MVGEVLSLVDILCVASLHRRDELRGAAVGDTSPSGRSGWGWQSSLPFVWESSSNAWSSALRWMMSQGRVSGHDYQEDLYYQYCGGCLPWTPWLGGRSGALQAAGRSLVFAGPSSHGELCPPQHLLSPARHKRSSGFSSALLKSDGGADKGSCSAPRAHK